MLFRSTRSPDNTVSFKEAVLRALPPGGGLYVPTAVVDMRQFFLYMDPLTTYPELVSTLAPSLLQGALNPGSASRVAESAFDFEPELLRLDESLSVLTLSNGPTGVFKDFGTAFLAAVMEELLKPQGSALVLCAAQGDNGAGIARSFAKRRGLRTVILYPSGPMRGLDPAVFIQNGGNCVPIQIKGSFDDCQRLIIAALEDRPFAERYGITSGNAVNVGRLLPQALYYLYAFIKAKPFLQGDLVFSVPCGNFGNLVAGLYAWKFGMPGSGFIAAMNANNAFGDFIRGRGFSPRPLLHTVSPALDVRIPSNYERLAAFYEEAPAVMRNMVYPDSVDDQAALEAITQAWERYRLLLDPHTATAYAAAERHRGGRDFYGHIVVLATGHPARSAATVAIATGQDVEVPERLRKLQHPVDPTAVINPCLEELQCVISSSLIS